MNAKMWFYDEVFFPRVMRSCLWMLLIQTIHNNVILLCLKLLCWSPLSGLESWILNIFSWKTFLCHIFLSLVATVFALVHSHYYSVEKRICSTRFEKVCQSFNLYHLRHVFMLSVLGGIYSYCLLQLFRVSFSKENTILESCFVIEDGLKILFVVTHGIYTGMIFSLKYFICDLYLVKFSLIQETKLENIIRQLFSIVKENFFGVLKVLHWHYVFFMIFISFLKELLSSTLSLELSNNTSIFYNLLNIPLFFTTLASGVILCLSWNLYICIFNAFAAERYQYLIEGPIKGEKNKILFEALKCDESPLMKYLAVLDLRLLSQYDARRRQQYFSISNPGGHPHYWNALSEICISFLQDFLAKLNLYLILSQQQPSSLNQQPGAFNRQPGVMSPLSQKNIVMSSLSQKNIVMSPLSQKNNIIGLENKRLDPLDKVKMYLRGRPLVAYFLDEIPNAKIMKLFASSQPIVWIIEALGHFISASYTEDKYGVLQRHTPEIICLLLDIKMAEEKLPIGLVGIQKHVQDSQGRYDHLHQRFSIKCAVNFSLKKISMTFKDDISGICLPEQHKRYFQRYVNQKNM